MKKLSIVGRDFLTDERVAGITTPATDEVLGKAGGVLGADLGTLVGMAFFFIHRHRSVLVAGPLVQIIVATLEGAVVVGGMSAVSAGLYTSAFRRTACSTTSWRSRQQILLVATAPARRSRARRNPQQDRRRDPGAAPR